ncbi:TadE-like protein [Pseudomonas flavescens]|uniref:TadE-like protein n=1 Tax=Phytopseudomonas flavescens TaxID=29435 RepID=A0A1G8ATJ0_9GAMM|nr:TadE family protein [Pseudomonas flavescens]SDH24259.1 TadE-like protein [Pseudomonas flavescens]
MPHSSEMPSGHKQRGAVAVEFSITFVIFFLIFYGMVGYSIPFLLSATYQELATEALRDAIRSTDTRAPTAQQLATHQQRVLQTMRNSWLPQAWTQTCSGYDGFLKTGAVWSVCVRHGNPESIMPALSIFGWKVPQLPSELRGEAKIRLYNAAAGA